MMNRLAIAMLPLAVAAGAALAAAPTRAVAVLEHTKDSTVAGKVTFTKAEGGVKVEAHVTGLTPGKHGFHIHEFGDCSAADGTSAGGHFNPTGDPHAGPKDDKRHEGDMGNIEADKDGAVALEYVDAKLSFDGPGSILGRGVIVHAAADDFKTQPTGNAGGRLGCGVIGAAKGE
jgi:superoxide dismutase, Cu-Zn family